MGYRTFSVTHQQHELILGFPLDDGRILRSILWSATDNLRRATRWAARVGQAIAWLMIASGSAMAFGATIPFFGSGFISGLWLAFIGWFLNSALVRSYRQDIMRWLQMRSEAEAEAA